MAGAPWFLFAFGILLVILGYFITAMGSGSGRDFLDPKMSDKEIARRMKQSQGSPFGPVVMWLGGVVIVASLIWRIVRYFV